jgi:hypothetical protein
MASSKNWLLAAAIMLALGGGALMMNLASSRPALAQVPGPGDHWRNFDGHWSYWHAGDKRWYYTDGLHWYFHDGLHWALYPFDHAFGRDFHHGEYRVPGPEVRVDLPHHGIYHH